VQLPSKKSSESLDINESRVSSTFCSEKEVVSVREMSHPAMRIRNCLSNWHGDTASIQLDLLFRGERSMGKRIEQSTVCIRFDASSPLEDSIVVLRAVSAWFVGKLATSSPLLLSGE
jgi:hypothetical protein